MKFVISWILLLGTDYHTSRERFLGILRIASRRRQDAGTIAWHEPPRDEVPVVHSGVREGEVIEIVKSGTKAFVTAGKALDNTRFSLSGYL
jgi:hypothetical protein